MMANAKEQPIRVYEVMSFPVVTAFEDDTIKSIALKMLQHKIGSVVVTDRNNKETGIITQGDIVRFFATAKPNEDLFNLEAKELMSSPLVYIGGDKELDVAAKKMVDYKVKKLCVRDADRKLAGMITDNDIMKNASYLISVLASMVNTGYALDAEVAEEVQSAQ